jgi:hypothetical protein
MKNPLSHTASEYLFGMFNCRLAKVFGYCLLTLASIWRCPGSDHSIRINTTPVTLGDLSATIFRIYSARPNKNMFVRGDTKLPYGEVFRVMDIAKHSGAGEIAMLVRETAPTPAVGK